MKNIKVRGLFQFLFLTYIIFVSLGHAFAWSFGTNLHGLCPFGAVETLHTYLTTDDFLHHIGTSNFVALLALFITLIIGGAFFCGYICPLGTIQEYLGKVGKKIAKGKYYNRVPNNILRRLSFFRYIFLALILFQTSRSFSLVFEQVDPYYNLFNIWSDEIAISGYISVLVLIITSFFIERPFCRLACPLGAINGLINKISFFNIYRNKETCISCQKCNKICPMSIDVATSTKVTSTLCIRCGNCIENCPVNDKNTLKYRFLNKKIIKKELLDFPIPLIFFTIFFFGFTLGYMEEDEEEKLFLTANDIRGSYTIEEIIEHFPLTEEEFYYALNLDSTLSTETKVNDLEKDYEYSTEDIRYLIENINMNIKELLETTPSWMNNESTLREVIKEAESGRVIKYIIGVNRVEVEGLDLRRKSMLVDIERYVDDYEAFLIHFNIPNNLDKNTTMRELEEQYGASLEDIKLYLSEHPKK